MTTSKMQDRMAWSGVKRRALSRAAPRFLLAVPHSLSPRPSRSWALASSSLASRPQDPVLHLVFPVSLFCSLRCGSDPLPQIFIFSLLLSACRGWGQYLPFSMETVEDG